MDEKVEGFLRFLIDWMKAYSLIMGAISLIAMICLIVLLVNEVKEDLELKNGKKRSKRG